MSIILSPKNIYLGKILQFRFMGVLCSAHLTFYAEVIEEKRHKNILLKGLNTFKVKQSQKEAKRVQYS